MRSQAGRTTEVERVREKFLTIECLDAVRSVGEDILQPQCPGRLASVPGPARSTPTGSNCPACANPGGFAVGPRDFVRCLS
jgi:hypothetical protein